MKTKEYNVEVCETLIRIVTVEATSEEEALELARNDYNNAELVLDADDFFDVDFEIVNRD
jgi:5-bromo-4-chloroindolyl phosphate hydrolysis protein